MKAIILNIILILTPFAIFAQTSVNASGTTSSNDHGSVSFSVGQLVNGHNSNDNYSISEGVQQVFEISVFSEPTYIPEGYSATVYPNPTQDFFHLEVNLNQGNEISYELYDINGKLILSESLNDDQALMDMQNYPASVYYLKTICNGKTVETFKIIKTQ